MGFEESPKPPPGGVSFQNLSSETVAFLNFYVCDALLNPELEQNKFIMQPGGLIMVTVGIILLECSGKVVLCMDHLDNCFRESCTSFLFFYF